MAEERDRYAAALAELLGGDAARIVAPAAAPGSAVRSVSARQVLYRPGSRVTVTYAASLEWSDGRSHEELVVATAGDDGPPAGPAAAPGGGGEGAGLGA